LIALLFIELALAVVLIFPSSKFFHVVGYFIAAVLVAITVVTFRSVDRTRRRSSSYISYSWPSTVAVVALIVALILAMVHAYYFAQSRQIAP